MFCQLMYMVCRDKYMICVPAASAGLSNALDVPRVYWRLSRALHLCSWEGEEV